MIDDYNAIVGGFPDTEIQNVFSLDIDRDVIIRAMISSTFNDSIVSAITGHVREENEEIVYIGIRSCFILDVVQYYGGLNVNLNLSSG